MLDPHYGDVLFQFFQQRYFSALTGLMVSQHFERMPEHADDAELLRGGLLLSYGMHREAGQIFERLIAKGAPPPVRDRAWFYLAKIRYQRGLLGEARDALGRIGKALPPALADELPLLHANVLMRLGDFAGAARLLEQAQARPGARAADAAAYLRYNLGVALIRSGDSKRGSPLLEELGRAPEARSEPQRSPAVSEELRELRDKTNVALGFTALQEGRANVALAYLQRVRLSGIQSNKALLGFGWAAAAEQKYKQALVPWLELVERDPSDAAVLEARVAVAYAYAQVGAYGQSLERYQQAIAAFEREGAELDESIQAIRAGKLLDALIARNPGEEMGWFWSIGELPADMPHPSHLAPLFAQHQFQEAFKNYRDLRFMAHNLEDWQHKLGTFGDMLDNRRRAYAERLPRVRAEAGALDLAALGKRRAAVATELAAAEAQPDGYAFADARQRELLQRLDGVRAALKRAGRDPAVAQARERTRLAAGALAWELARAQPGRAWEARKALKTIDEQLAEAAQSQAALARAQREEPARFDAFAVRNAELARRVQALMPRIEALALEQQQQVQELAVAELQRQKESLAGYTAQARFAVAQLYDRAATEQEAERAPR